MTLIGKAAAEKKRAQEEEGEKREAEERAKKVSELLTDT